MRTLILALVLAALAPSALATISVYQNDAGTGGDGGTWSDHPAPLRNRHGGVEGAYSGELYHVADEIDWYSFVVPAGTTALKLAFSAQGDGACATLDAGAVFAAGLLDPSGAPAGRGVVEPCYGADSLSVASPLAGKWRVSFGLEHADETRVDVGAGPFPASVPDSTITHERYAFAVDCAPDC